MTYLTKAKLIEAMKDLPDDTPIFVSYHGSDANTYERATELNLFTVNNTGNYFVRKFDHIQSSQQCVSICYPDPFDF